MLKTPLSELAAALGVDFGSMNQQDAINKTCTKALAKINELNADVFDEIGNRDAREAVCNMLAEEIARFADVDIGEHTSANCPWNNAMEALPDTTLTELKKQVVAEIIPEKPTPEIMRELAHFQNSGGVPADVLRYTALSKYFRRAAGILPGKIRPACDQKESLSRLKKKAGDSQCRPD